MTSYQVAIFSDGADSESARLRETIISRLDDLGMRRDALTFLTDAMVLARDRKAPTVAAYFGFKEHPPPMSTGLSDLLRTASLIVPVVPRLSNFSQFVPPELHGLNGMEPLPNDPDLNAVAAVLLEGLDLLRNSRRLFISYRRGDTQTIAIQLYELLDSRGFDVFLDSHSIRPGEPFQEVLWHRLADTDVILLLDSPNFLASRWTQEELARANTTNVQILQLIWPGASLPAVAALSQAFKLTDTDFAHAATTIGNLARLKDTCMDKIAATAESLRARALAARYAYLVEEFCIEAAAAGFSARVQPRRFIELQAGSRKRVAVVPTVGVPDAVRYHDIEDDVAKVFGPDAAILLLYDERGIRDKWLRHLGWLDAKMSRVASLQVTSAQRWLAELP